MSAPYPGTSYQGQHPPYPPYSQFGKTENQPPGHGKSALSLPLGTNSPMPSPAGPSSEYGSTATSPQYGFKTEVSLYAPTAPPPDHLDPIPGYENTKFDTEVPILPPPPSAAYEPPKYDGETVNGVILSEQEARDALHEYARSECCYGKQVPTEMTLTKIDNTSAYHYQLDTFAEGRTTAWKYEPYKGEPITTYGTVPVPGPWDITVLPPSEPFKDSKTSLPVPGTACNKMCFQCNGSGYVSCQKCLQRGWIECSTCKGKGCRTTANNDIEDCPFCSGRGRNNCRPCRAQGTVKCDVCTGLRQLKHFIELTVTWKNYTDDFIVERTELPDMLIKNCGGTVVFSQELPLVPALSHFPDNDLNIGASNKLFERVETVTKSERILTQRHKVIVVPVSEVSYNWREENFSFFVYGTNQCVYTTKYPQDCCFGWCTIL